MYELLQQIQGLGGDFSGMSWQDLFNLDQGTIAESLQTVYGGQDQDPWTPQMFSALTPSALKTTEHKTYSPAIETGMSSLVSDLSLTMGGKKAKTAAGGFSGSGGFESFAGGAKDVYGKKAGGVLQDVFSQQAIGRKGVQDIISQWQETAQSMMV